MAAVDGHEAAAAPPVTPLKALVLLPILLVLIGVFIALSAAAGSHEVYVGFLFLLYWAGLQHADMKALPATVVSSVAGLSLAYALNLLTAQFGPATGPLVFLAVILPVLFCQVLGKFTLVINMATMLMLTAGTISHVQAHADFPGMFVNLGLAVVYFGGLLFGVNKLKARSEAKAAMAAQASPAE